MWGERPCASGSSFAALAEQTQRLPAGSIRCGEVVVALGGGGGGAGGSGAGGFSAGGACHCTPRGRIPPGPVLDLSFLQAPTAARRGSSTA